MAEKSRQINIPLSEDTHRSLEKYAEELNVSKAEIARRGLGLVFKRLSGPEEESKGLVGVDKLYETIDNFVPTNEQTERLKVTSFFGGTNLELISPTYTSVESPNPEFKFTLGTDIVKSHAVVLAEQQSEEPLVCRIEVLHPVVKEIASQEVEIDVTEGTVEDIGTETRVVSFSKDRFSQHLDQRLQWRLVINFMWAEEVGRERIFRRAKVEKEAGFRILSQESKKVFELKKRYFEALAYLEEGLYEQAREKGKQAAKLDNSDRFSRRIEREVYRKRAQGLTGAEQEEELEEPVSKFADLYNRLVAEGD